MTDASAPWAAAAEDAQRQILQLIERGQEAILQAVQQWRVGGDWQAPPMPNMPELASPEDVLKMQFEFAERVLAAQRRFAEQLLAAVRPSSK